MYNAAPAGQKKGEREARAGGKLCNEGVVARGSREGSVLQASPWAVTQLFFSSLFAFKWKKEMEKKKGEAADGGPGGERKEKS